MKKSDFILPKLRLPRRFDYDSLYAKTIKKIPGASEIDFFDTEVGGLLLRLIVNRLKIKQYAMSLNADSVRYRLFFMAYATSRKLRHSADGKIVNRADKNGYLIPEYNIAPFDARKALKIKGPFKVTGDMRATLKVARKAEKWIRDKNNLVKMNGSSDIYVARDDFREFAYLFDEYIDRKISSYRQRFRKNSRSERLFDKSNRITFVQKILNWRIRLDLRKLRLKPDKSNLYSREAIRKLMDRGHI